MTNKSNKNLKGRGAQVDPANSFERTSYESFDEFVPEEEERPQTKHIIVHPKSIVNKVNSPDVGMAYSLNPYQGCEHGCIYCYARNSHEYWGYSAGTEFESNILIKKNAPDLLRTWLRKTTRKTEPIVISGNTDCYQPAEKKYQLTRKILQVFAEYRHPCSIITKNALIKRDLDVLKELASQDLVKVAVSITTLDESLRREMEPRTASVHNRLNTINELSNAGIPVSVMIAPVIPGLNDHEIPQLLEKTAQHGAIDAGFTVVRLNHQIGEIFSDWIHQKYPGYADKVLNQIAACHDGKLNDSRRGKRIKGDGKISEMIEKLFRLHKNKHFAEKPSFKHNCSLFRSDRGRQLSIFEQDG